MKLVQKSVKKLVDFLGDLKAQKFHSEIKCQNIMQIAGKQSQHQTDSPWEK